MLLRSVQQKLPGGGHGNPLWYSCLENPHGPRSLGLQSTGSQRVGHNRATEHSMAETNTTLVSIYTPTIKFKNKFPKTKKQKLIGAEAATLGGKRDPKQSINRVCYRHCLRLHKCRVILSQQDGRRIFSPLVPSEGLCNYLLVFYI